jgi:hypothetical protein
LEDPGVFEGIILKLIEYIKEISSECEYWTDLAEVRDRCEGGNEPSGFIKFGEFLYKLKTVCI